MRARRARGTPRSAGRVPSRAPAAPRTGRRRPRPVPASASPSGAAGSPGSDPVRDVDRRAAVGAGGSASARSCETTIVASGTRAESHSAPASTAAAARPHFARSPSRPWTVCTTFARPTARGNDGRDARVRSRGSGRRRASEPSRGSVASPLCTIASRCLCPTVRQRHARACRGARSTGSVDVVRPGEHRHLVPARGHAARRAPRRGARSRRTWPARRGAPIMRSAAVSRCAPASA